MPEYNKSIFYNHKNELVSLGQLWRYIRLLIDPCKNKPIRNMFFCLSRYFNLFLVFDTKVIENSQLIETSQPNSS